MKHFFKLNRITFQRLYEDTRAWFQAVYNLTADQFTPASPWGQIIETIINISQMIFYYIEDSITELNIHTASRRQSIMGLAALTGHSVTRAMSANGDMEMQYSGQNVDMYGQVIIIPNYSKILCVNNNQRYVLSLNQDDIRVNIGNSDRIRVKIIQGNWENQTFTGNGEILQSYEVNLRGRREIDNKHVNVYVNSELFPKYESLYDIPYQKAGCLIRTGMTSGVDIFFGTDYNGKVPQTGSEIRVEYLLTTGIAGNVLSNFQNLEFRWEDSGYDITGKEIDLNTALNVNLVTPLIFGTTPEPIELTKLIAPRTSRSYVLANPDNYSIFLQKMNYFSLVECFSTFDDDNLEDDNVIYIFAIPDILNRVRNNEDYFTIPQGQFIMTDLEKDGIYRLLQESGQMIITTIVKVLDPVITRYVLNISLIIYEGYDIDTIREKIIDRVSQYFLNNKRRDRVPKSDLIAIVESIEGVDSVDLYFVNEGNELNKLNYLERLALNPDEVEPDDIGLDEHGNILIAKQEYPILRGGWSDRNEVFYQDSADLNVTSSVNIDVARISRKTVNSELHSISVKSLKS